MKKIYLTNLLSLFLFCTAAHATVHMVNVVNFEFQPSSLNVTVGDTVRWVWGESGSHTTTSTDIPATAAAWDELINVTEQTFSYVVTKSGTYNYKCTFHESMGMVGSFTASGTSLVLPNEPAPFFTLNGNIITDQISMELHLATASEVTIQLHSMLGRLVKTLDTSKRTAGAYTETYLVGDIPKGMYVLELFAGNKRVTRSIFIE